MSPNFLIKINHNSIFNLVYVRDLVIFLSYSKVVGSFIEATG